MKTYKDVARNLFSRIGHLLGNSWISSNRFQKAILEVVAQRELSRDGLKRGLEAHFAEHISAPRLGFEKWLMRGTGQLRKHTKYGMH